MESEQEMMTRISKLAGNSALRLIPRGRTNSQNCRSDKSPQKPTANERIGIKLSGTTWSALSYSKLYVFTVLKPINLI